MWQVVGTGMGFCGNLRDAVVCSTSTSAAYISEGLRYMEDLPWSLVVGDIESNLNTLASNAQEPQEETGKNIFDVASNGL